MDSELDDELEGKELKPGVKGEEKFFAVFFHCLLVYANVVFLVEMYNASGTVVQRTELVHNKELQPKICVDSVEYSEAKLCTFLSRCTKYHASRPEAG